MRTATAALLLSLAALLLGAGGAAAQAEALPPLPAWARLNPLMNGHREAALQYNRDLVSHANAVDATFDLVGVFECRRPPGLAGAVLKLQSRNAPCGAGRRAGRRLLGRLQVGAACAASRARHACLRPGAAGVLGRLHHRRPAVQPGERGGVG